MVLCRVGLLCAQTYNYGEVLQKSMWFYEVQRSGKLPDNNRVEWRASSALSDGSDVGHDLTGGWYDAGDNMKFNFPMASAVTLLAWGGLEFYEGYHTCGQWGWLLENIKWVTEYFIKCHTAPNEFYGQVGQGMIDHKWWGAPEVFPNPRPAFKIDAQHPGSELAAEAAAALAASSLLFRGTDQAYADKLLLHAKQLYTFADTYRGLYSNSITDVTDFYKSWSGYQDELVWAAIWLYLATEDPQYLAKAEAGYDSLPKEPQSTTPIYKEALSWDDKSYGCYVLLAKITDKQRYHTDAQRWLNWWTYGYKKIKSGSLTWSSDSGVAYTPKGLAWIRSWGPIRYAANTALGAFVYAQCNSVGGAAKSLYTDWAKSQIDFALGSNELNRSYLCGFGVNPPVKPHHRAMHGPWLDDDGRTPVQSRHTLFGALVGGPSQDGSYIDDRLDAVRNEVAVDYNAGFSSCVARLCQTVGGTPVLDFPQPQKRDTEYMVVAKINTEGNKFTEISATIQNRTTWPARYSQNATIRYFIDCSEITAAGRKVSDISITLRADSGVTISKLIPYVTTGSLYYVEVSFAGAKIFPGGQSAFRREAQFRIALPDSAPQTLWDPSNDPSFKGLTTMADTLGDWNIPAYENGTLVWGKEPGGSSFTPPVWQKPAITEPQYQPPVWKQSLFKGLINAAVKAPPPIPTEPYRIVSHGDKLIITAESKAAVRYVALDGRLLHAEVIEKGQRRVLNTPVFAAGPFVVYVADAHSSYTFSKLFPHYK